MRDKPDELMHIRLQGVSVGFNKFNYIFIPLVVEKYIVLRFSDKTQRSGAETGSNSAVYDHTVSIVADV